jgi:hypothetical protein
MSAALYHPSVEIARPALEQGRPVAVSREVLADLDTGIRLPEGARLRSQLPAGKRGRR